MLSEVIHSRHSYSAMPRARQPIHQRSVRSGPLVTFIPSDQNQKLRTIPLFLGAQTISSSFDKLRINPRLDRMLAYYKHEPTSTIYRGFPVSCESVLIQKSVTSRYGVNSIFFNRQNDFPRYYLIIFLVLSSEFRHTLDRRVYFLIGTKILTKTSPL